MAQHKFIAYDTTLKRQTIPGPTDTYLAAVDVEFSADFTLGGTFNGYNMAVQLPKIALIDITAPADLDNIATKVGYLGVTGYVDLDEINTRVNSLDAAVILMGGWDASTGLFPASTKAGESWIVTVAGTVSSVNFQVNDRVIAIVDGAPNNSYTDFWLKADYTDQVLSVAGKTGAVLIEEADITDLQPYLLSTDLDSLAKLNVIVGAVLDTTSDPRDPNAHTHSYDEITDAQTLNDGLTAYAGGGQTNGLLMTAGKINILNTVATAGDSAKLPAAAEGIQVEVWNRGANYADLFPNTSDNIELRAIDVALQLYPGTKVTLLALDNTQWVIK